LYHLSLYLSSLKKTKRWLWDKDLKNLWFAWRWFDGSYGEINPPSQEVKKTKRGVIKKGEKVYFFPLSLSLSFPFFPFPEDHRMDYNFNYYLTPPAKKLGG